MLARSLPRPPPRHTIKGRNLGPKTLRTSSALKEAPHEFGTLDINAILHAKLQNNPLVPKNTHPFSVLFRSKFFRPTRNPALPISNQVRTMTTNNSEDPSGMPPITEKDQAVTVITELLVKLKNKEPTSNQNLMTVFERIKEINKPTKESTIELFKAIETKFPHKTLGEDRWYLVALSALVGVDPDLAGGLYTHLINKPEYKTPESRQGLVRRLREALVKNVSLQGVCKPLEALFAIEALERPEDKDFSFSREHWKAGPENRARGEKWLNTIYKANLSTATDKFVAHKDFDFISKEITYGLYLSDHSILDPLATELVTLAGIMIQNLPLETAWHLRGARRVGVSMKDLDLVQECVKMVADFGFISQNKVPRAADIEHQV